MSSPSTIAIARRATEIYENKLRIKLEQERLDRHYVPTGRIFGCCHDIATDIVSQRDGFRFGRIGFATGIVQQQPNEHVPRR